MILPKKKIKNEEKKTHNIEMGTLYDINKNLVSKIEDLSKEQLEEKEELISDFILETNNKYYMMLCNERKDYTVFTMTSEDDSNIIAAEILVNECLVNRGRTKAIDITNTKDAIEIWMAIDDLMYCYYFFPYDSAIIEC